MLVSMDVSDKQLQKAVSRVQAQIAKAPPNSQLYVQLSELELRAGDANASLDAAQKAMQLNPADGTAVMAYSRAQLAHGDANKAIDGWQQWLKAHPNDAAAYAVAVRIRTWPLTMLRAHADRYRTRPAPPTLWPGSSTAREPMLLPAISWKRRSRSLLTILRFNITWG